MYFKCSFCKLFNKERHGDCIMFGFKRGGSLPGCKYGTFFSVWKWFVLSLKYLGSGLIVLSILPGIYWAFTRTINWSTDGASLPDVLAGAIRIWTGMGTIVGIMAIIAGIHKAFCEQGGEYKL